MSSVRERISEASMLTAPEIVDQHGHSAALGLGQQVIEQRGLAGPEVTANHREG